MVRLAGTPSVSPSPARPADRDTYDVIASGRALLDAADARLAAGALDDLDAFVERLDFVRTQVGAAAWDAFVAQHAAPHPVRARLHEDPFTRRAFEKPRGYAGDAPLLDLIYGDTVAADAADAADARTTSALGARLHAWAVRQPACQSVRERRELLAALIDRVAAEGPAPRILSVACGHLREAQRSEAVRAGAVREFVALDQDVASLAVVAREQAEHGVRAVRASVRRFLAAPHAFGAFDLAYAAGLYDYLDAPVARALTAAMFGAVRPGGTLLVANFAPELRDIGYMDAVMEWRLIYRNELAVADFAAEIPPNEIAERSVFRDSTGNVVYLSLRKA